MATIDEDYYSMDSNSRKGFSNMTITVENDLTMEDDLKIIIYCTTMID